MQYEFSATDAAMATQLERLVCGDLDESARKPLIAWLDQNPNRWRLCGLLFLEAQTWSESIKDWPAHTPSPLPAEPNAARSNRSAPGKWRSLRDAAVLAASVLIAFVLGAAVRNEQANRAAQSAVIADKSKGGVSASPQGDARIGSDVAPVMAMLPTASGVGIPFQPAMHIPVVPGGASAGEISGGVDSISDYVRQQWARRGYQLDVERRFLLAKLPGGQQVAVPFEQYSLKPIIRKIN